MAPRLDRPVHLYVKKHRVTGLKYFGRTAEDPYVYPGSGAYWRRHLAEYGDDVSTKVVGSFWDVEELHAAARRFSAEHDIAASTKWANLLPESGDVTGDGWEPGHDHTAQIAKLDAAVRRRLETRRMNEQQTDPRPAVTLPRQPNSQVQDADATKRSDGRFAKILVALSVVGGVVAQSNNTPGDGYGDSDPLGLFVLGAAVVALTPIGWIAAALVSWVFDKFSDQ